MRKALLLLPIALMTAACGFQPLYGGGARSPVAQTLRSISVSPIAGEPGWLVRGALRDRLALTADAPEQARYRLDVRLDDQITGFGVRADDSVTRERRTLRARWQLVDTATDTTIIDDTAAADMGIDVVNSEYATIAAEQSALERLSHMVADQIVARVAIYARNPADSPAPTAPVEQPATNSGSNGG